MLDFRMETFLTVCEYMNFTRAGEILHLSQPAVSQHIKFLEDRYKAPLFIREKKRLSLTPAGEILKATLETMRNDENTLKKRIIESKLDKKILTFGVTMTVGQYTIIPALCSFIKSHPLTDLKIRYANTQTLLQYLREGIIDFAIVEGYFRAEQYETRIFKSEEFVAVCSTKHKFKNKIKYLKDLTNESLLIREQGSGTRAIFTKNLALNNMSINNFSHIIEIENIQTIVKLLVQDCGISFLYKAAISQELNNNTLKIISLKDFHLSHDFTFLWNKNSAFSKEYETIFQELKFHHYDNDL